MSLPHVFGQAVLNILIYLGGNKTYSKKIVMLVYICDYWPQQLLLQPHIIGFSRLLKLGRCLQYMKVRCCVIVLFSPTRPAIHTPVYKITYKLGCIRIRSKIKHPPFYILAHLMIIQKTIQILE